MVNIQQHLNLLGHKVQDQVTGLNGVVTSVCFDLYGCIQAIVHPGLDGNGKLCETTWFDINRLIITDPNPVMQRPEFEWTPKNISAGLKGPSERPRQNKA